MKRFIPLLAAFLLSSALAQAPQRGLLSIRADELREKVTYLASREMKGRGDGSPELRRAAEYIADAFKRHGVKPAGDGGTYFQNFRMFMARLGTRNDFRSGNTDYILGGDYVPHYLSPSAEVEGSLIFMGYGISAPSLKFDEFAGVNLRGRIAVVLDATPHARDFGSDFNRVDFMERASILTKARNVAAAGGIGMVVLQNPEIPNVPIAEWAATFRPDYPRRDVPMGILDDARNPQIPVIILSEGAGRRLVPSLRDLQRNIDVTLRPRSVDLGRRARLRVDIQPASFPTQNVLGLIEGSHPQLRREVVVVGAHYDHDGEHAGQIWPGADDNASGTSGVLELAEAFGSGHMVPARSILLCAFAGEEKGELGSQHYADHPVIPVNRTVAMLQMDMIGRNEEHPANRVLQLERETSAQNANSVNLIGSIFSPDLRRIMEDANRRVGLVLKFRYDDTPENLLRRSDQWAFLKVGIPALFVHTGEHPDYHQPGDTPDKINYPKMEKIVRLVFLAVETIANSPARPAFAAPD